MDEFPESNPGLDAVVEQIRRGFAASLPLRGQKIELALERMKHDPDKSVFEHFYIEAHGLKGSSATFEADDVHPPAKALADRGYRWREAGHAPMGEIADAELEMRQLAVAIKEYLDQVLGGDGG